MFTALSIAGSDSSGGAGIQADIKTMSALGIYAMTAITALTAQNTTGVSDIMEATPVFLGKQLDSVFTDIYPDAVKIGMLSSKEIMEVVAHKLTEYRAKNIVLDPVMVATSGADLIKGGATEYMKENLFPLASIITPNIPETEALTGINITSASEMEEAGMKLYEAIKDTKQNIIASLSDRDTKRMYLIDTAVLVKGGHSINDANDYLFIDGQKVLIEGKRINNSNTHGTGCTLSSAIAAGLAKGLGVEKAVRNAKDYISGALADGLDLGKGSGPLNHMYILKD